MKLVVGLGNPGRKYEGTRHNIGFEVVRELTRRHGTGTQRARFNGETVEAEVAGQKVLILCPLTYMNNSGQSVVQARDFYKLANDEVLVVCDDFNLPTGKLRTRAKGSAGGQKGLQDILNRLGGQEVPRLRIGIGQPPEGWDVTGYVLGKFTSAERTEMDVTVQQAADAVETWIREGCTAAMNQHN